MQIVRSADRRARSRGSKVGSLADRESILQRLDHLEEVVYNQLNGTEGWEGRQRRSRAALCPGRVLQTGEERPGCLPAGEGSPGIVRAAPAAEVLKTKGKRWLQHFAGGGC